MINLFRQFLQITGLSRLLTSAKDPSIPIRDSFEDLDLSENLSLETIDLIFAVNEDSVIPARNLASARKSRLIIDLNRLPNSKNLNNARFNSALTSSDLIFSANRQLATQLELNLKRHINISRHLSYFEPHQKYIDLKKVYHLIDDTQLIIFDANKSHNFKNDLTFIANLLAELPRHIHIVITGTQLENKVYSQHLNLFDAHNCTSRAHFYVENLEAIKYPIDYSSIDIALILEQNFQHTPPQYYKYLHEKVVIFANSFSDSNQLISSADIGQTFTDQNIETWKIAINSYLNLSEAKRDDYSDKLELQKQHINWKSETDHLISSTLNLHQNTPADSLHAVIVDLSIHNITERTHSLGHMLVEQGMNVSILAPFLPAIHAPQTSNIEYIKVS
ncbi:MAG: hypothetical protein OCD03_14625 [Hyphomicrobiales bacterium]